MINNKQMWHSYLSYSENKIETFYIAEEKLWLFSLDDILKVIESVKDLNNKKVIQESNKSKFVNIYLDDSWVKKYVLTQKDISLLFETCDSLVLQNLNNWILEICNTIPKGCYLTKDTREYDFLNMSCNRFLDLYEEINSAKFMSLLPEIRLYKIKDLFSIYSELLLYKPIVEHIKFIEKTRPSMEFLLSKDFVKFIRNILIHFPFFTTWEDIYVSKDLINWASNGQFIDKFLNKYQGHEPAEFRFMEMKSRKWRYPAITFPKLYNSDKIFVKDIINENDGILLCAILMHNVIMSQIIEINDKKENN